MDGCIYPAIQIIIVNIILTIEKCMFQIINKIVYKNGHLLFWKLLILKSIGREIKICKV